MKTLVNGMDEPRYWNHIASFGPARLVTDVTGRVELLGGSSTERAEAREWIALFMHDAVLTENSPSKPNSECRRRRRHLTPPQTFWSGCRSYFLRSSK